MKIIYAMSYNRVVNAALTLYEKETNYFEFIFLYRIAIH
jgi:hypothetical protein